MTETPFKQTITTEAALREIIGHPSQIVVNKAMHEIDEMLAGFIAKSPFMVIASADAAGNMDVSPKGDPPGFVRVHDRNTLLIPDRPGNRRADTLTNIIHNPRVSLLFLVPGKGETVRVNGRAQIVLDDALRAQFEVQGKLPTLLIAVTVEEAFFHCAKCVFRSKIWEENPTLELPHLAEVMISQLGLDAEIEKLKADIDAAYRTELY